MKTPRTPPDFGDLLSRIMADDRIGPVLELADQLDTQQKYYHWDDLARRKAPSGYSTPEWWLAIKLKRKASRRPLPLLDKSGTPFSYFLHDGVQKLLHDIDAGAGGFIGIPDPIIDPQTRDRYLVGSLIEEALTSSQLEGAVSTREVAKEMIRTGRRARDRSEQMILNNFRTMQHIRKISDQKLTPEVVLDIHTRVAEKTLDNPDAVGRLRSASECIRVMGPDGVVLHTPPAAAELPDRLQRMCDFANDMQSVPFVHPVIRAITLHFWLAYDHPFVDGNGRTARALFYWAMLRHGYWLFEFVSISRTLLKAPVKYARSFLHTETDENDLNYFILHQVEVINRAIGDLHDYIDRTQRDLQTAQNRLELLHHFNHRQQAVIIHAMKHPLQEYTFASHQRSHMVAYATSRKDLLGLVERGVLTQEALGKAMVFRPVPDLEARLLAFN
jgi:Fic family protein